MVHVLKHSWLAPMKEGMTVEQGEGKGANIIATRKQREEKSPESRRERHMKSPTSADQT